MERSTSVAVSLVGVNIVVVFFFLLLLRAKAGAGARVRSLSRAWEGILAPRGILFARAVGDCGDTHRVEFTVLLLLGEELGKQFGVSSFGGIMEGAARIRRSGREGARSATGYPGAPRHAIRNRSAGNAGRISGSADRDTHKTPVTSSSSSLSNMCARSRSEMLLTRSSVRVELFLGLKASNPV